jgi:hypothetical protein
MIKKQKCLGCSTIIEVDTMARFKKKYCEKCRKKRKKLWDNQWKVKFEDLPDD